jgi:hypothetical protein
VEKTVAGYHDKTFQAHFRMNRNLVYRLIGRLQQTESRKQPNGKELITNEKAILLTLWYVAKTETF